jgi:hypothetical protein
MRRTLIIIAIVIVLLGIAVAAYVYFARTPSVIVTPQGGNDLPIAGEATPGVGEEQAGTAVPSDTSVPMSARIVKISAGPIVPGEVVVNIKAVDASSSPEVAVNYIERISGNVFTYQVGTATLTRISNKTIPGIQTASWLPNASLAFVRYLSGTDFSTINTYALSPKGSEGFFLPQNLAEVAVASTSVLTLSSGVNGSVASLRHTYGTSISTVFTTPLSALHVSFAGKNRYLAFTKPSMALPGNAFLIDSSGHFSRISGPKNGLVALASPLGRWVLVSFVQDDSMRMELINTTTAEIVPLPIATIADKCVWAADDSTIYCGIPVNPPAGKDYPDDWYQGAVSFNDRIWKIQVASRYAQLVLDFSTETKDSVDAEALAIDPLSTVLVFINKNDGSLWSYKL